MPKILTYIILFSLLLSPCVALANLPGKQVQEEKLPAWQNMWNWAKEKVLFIWGKIYSVLNREVEQRKTSVEDEFKKETEEMKQEIKEKAPSLWQRFLNLIYWTSD